MSRVDPRTILEAEAFVKKYFQGVRKNSKDCIKLWDKFTTEFLLDEKHEVWEIRTSTNEFVHMVVKWKNIYWDLNGKNNTLASIRRKFLGKDLYWCKSNIIE